MKRFLIILFLMPVVLLNAQGNANAVLRQQTFGVYSSVNDLAMMDFDTNHLVIFQNGFILTKEEFLNAFYGSNPFDSTTARKKTFLDKFIVSYQKAFEAMDQNMDTAMSFQINYLKYKQELITPYLNEGKSRAEAEALPQVKYSLRKYYVDQLNQKLNYQEVWSKSNLESEQKTYFYAHPELYQGQPFEVSKTKVVHDYQKELEAALTVNLNQKFTFKTNTKLLQQI